MISKNIKNNLLRKVGIVTGGVMISQVIMLVSSPIMTRMFEVSDLGLFGFLSGISMLFANIASLKYDSAIIISKSNKHAAISTVLSLLITSIVSATSLIVVFLYLSTNDYSKYGYWAIIFLPALIFFISFSSIVSQWTTRNGGAVAYSMSNISRSASTSLIQIVMGFFYPSIITLLIAYLLGYISSILINAFLLPVKFWRPLLSLGINKKKFILILKRYVELPKYSVPQTFLSSGSQALTMGILSYYFGAETAGLFWLTQRVMQQPGNLFGQAVRQVYIRHLVVLRDNKSKFIDSLYKASALSVIVSLGLMSPIILFGPYVFEICFGSGWEEAGVYARWMALWVVALIFNIPAWCALQAMRLNREILVLETLTITLQTLGLFVGCLYGDASISIISYTLIGACCFVLRTAYAFSATTKFFG